MIDLADTYAPRSSDVASEDFDGEFVVLDLASGRYFSLLGPSAIVWRGLITGHSLESLCSGLAGNSERRAEVERLVERLLAEKLIVSAPATAAPSAAIAAELAAAAGALKIETFDDLADLLVADPIHDVDQETGWPVLPSDRQT